jgi:23S rRNA pseudouridine1911/1915/1917 synthase
MSDEGAIISGKITTTGRLDRALAEACALDEVGAGLSRERIKALIGEGQVRVGRNVATSGSAKVVAGTSFAISLPPVVPMEAQAQDITLVIAYEDEDLIVVDKPAGLVVHPAAGNPDGTLVNALLHHCAQNGGGQLSGIGGVARPGIVHRIDKDTSGLLVVAKSDRAHEGLARQFADHSIERAYLAIVQGHPAPPRGTLRGVIARHPTDRKRMALQHELSLPPEEGGRGKHVVTHYRVREVLEEAALVECRLETGRTHQVRVHMASIGHALVGDPMYARTTKPLKPLLAELGFARQALHAAVLGFIHPVSGKAMRFASDIPDDMRELLARLGGCHTKQPGFYLPEEPSGAWPPPRDAS